MKVTLDPISGRRMATGLSASGSNFQLVQYGEHVHVGLLFSSGKWVQFMEHATIDEMVTRLTEKEAN